MIMFCFQVIKMLICVVMLFLLCWGPRFIMELLMKMQFSWLYYEHVYVIRIILFLLPMVHAILNPVVYFIMSRNFRTSVVTKCAKCCKKSRNLGSFEDLAMKNHNNHTTKNTTILFDGNGKTTFTTVVTANAEKFATNQELVVVHANGEVKLDLIEKSGEST